MRRSRPPILQMLLACWFFVGAASAASSSEPTKTIAQTSTASALAQTSATMPAMTAITENAGMPADASNATMVAGGDARLEVRFDYAASGPLKVSYRLRNEGKAPLMVFDRGNRHAVLTKKLVQGEIAAPTFTEENGDVTLSHRALPLPKPTPFIPPTPLATRIEPGAELAGEFEFAIPVAQAPKRLRWCLGVIPFAGDFKALKAEPNLPEVWLGSLNDAERQQLLCTPWYDVAKAAFEA